VVLFGQREDTNNSCIYPASIGLVLTYLNSDRKKKRGPYTPCGYSEGTPILHLASWVELCKLLEVGSFSNSIPTHQFSENISCCRNITVQSIGTYTTQVYIPSLELFVHPESKEEGDLPKELLSGSTR
jgi:hypothetical protein